MNRHKCPTPDCKKDRAYAFAFDSFYCEACDIWIDPPCEKENCIFCKDRPALPSLRHPVTVPGAQVAGAHKSDYQPD